jgi:hypothetical protein
MEKSTCPSSGCQSCSLDKLIEQQDPSTTAPPSTLHICCQKCQHGPSTRGGKSINLPPLGAASTRQSATTAIACALATIEATPILGPSQNSMPQAIGKGSCASIRASIDTAALEADSGDDDINGDEYSFFGKLANSDPKDLSPRNIDGNFILIFVGSRKCQETYPKTKKVKVFYEALTMEKKDILGNIPPPKQCKSGLTFGLKL